ncbi:hypothetical protein AAH991_18965 [Microbispora sp. ZYX-F-249]|uniref:Uncharacterized protein n=1 Tax=Microbispora maris TaxID=3144104 RepID=A0ABV0AR49_9ACTN
MSGAHLYGFPSVDSDLDTLTARPEDAGDACALPDVPSARDALHDPVVRARLTGR